MMTKSNDEQVQRCFSEKKSCNHIKIKNDSSVSIHSCNTFANKHLSPSRSTFSAILSALTSFNSSEWHSQNLIQSMIWKQIKWKETESRFANKISWYRLTVIFFCWVQMKRNQDRPRPNNKSCSKHSRLDIWYTDYSVENHFGNDLLKIYIGR